MRKVDLWLQLLMGFLSIALLLAGNVYALLIGELVRGVWQLLSAACNTYPMLKSIRKKQIVHYWLMAGSTLLVLVVILLTNATRLWSPEAFDMIIFFTVLLFTWAIAAYYWQLYKKFIDNLEWKQELRFLIKH